MLLYRYIAAGLIILGTGSFIFSLPHFLSPKLPPPSASYIGGDADAMDKNLCNNESKHTNESENELHASLAYHRCWFILGQILHGVGAAPILTLGTPLFLTLLYISFKLAFGQYYLKHFVCHF